MKAHPFKVDVPQTVLDDLQMRLAQTRWPDEVVGAGWEYGTNLVYLQELVAYWRMEFDWRTQEQHINRFAHYRADVDGLGIHFIHERGKGPNPVPLIITHGWPSSFVEMLKIIPLLADPASHGGDPADAFDIVVPSLPGYGFSDIPLPKGGVRIHELWAKLMKEGLGYDQFGAHGGDIGAGVTNNLGRYYADRVLGIHVTATDDPSPFPAADELSAAEKAFLSLRESWEEEEGGYSHIQGTRPQTLAYGLNDSPVGLAAWIIEKFRSWGDCDGEVERRFSRDELLTNVMIYWVTRTINASIRLYYEARHAPQPVQPRGRILVPTGIALTREAVDRAPREWAERTYNLQHWTDMPSGGHFLALEEPVLLAEDICAFFRPLRNHRLA